MRFLVPNYSCLQNPWLGATAHRSPFSLSSTEFVETSPPKKIRGYAYDSVEMFSAYTQEINLKVL